jgi:hypothetical protein
MVLIDKLSKRKVYLELRKEGTPLSLGRRHRPQEGFLGHPA